MMNTLLVGGKRQDSLCHSSGDSDDCLSEDGRGSYAGSATMGVATSSSAINPGRKRRRGIIEKRRRDRINQSLSELKRLVPAALEKSNSAKLEKAEILQMTVEHLKMVGGGGNGGSGAAGGRQYGSDPYEAHRIAVDYHLIGFKECAAEVARYLTVEGLEIPEQARVRLVTHLQMFASQKECYAAGSRTAAYHNSSATAAAAQQSQSSPAAATTAAQSSSWHGHNPYTAAYTPNCYPAAGESHDTNKMEAGYFGHYNSGHSFNQTTATSTPPPPSAPATSVAPSTSSYFSPFTAPAASTSTAPTSVTSSSYPSPYASSAKGQQPPYRPWGAEMASC